MVLSTKNNVNAAPRVVYLHPKRCSFLAHFSFEHVDAAPSVFLPQDVDAGIGVLARVPSWGWRHNAGVHIRAVSQDSLHDNGELPHSSYLGALARIGASLLELYLGLLNNNGDYVHASSRDEPHGNVALLLVLGQDVLHDNAVRALVLSLDFARVALIALQHALHRVL